MVTFPEYSAAKAHDSVGCMSTDFTRSELTDNFFLISKRIGCLIVR